ncbi:hypothetical protein HYPSUDRAFT_199521 [Hypholoma sublateritium FD-334 SS-4]|uniref:Uncharacterized protein n=1 Tax=Hypholoma sublateritium (strain FD-334 SS-4) TaxID=945553 RepID=A0A0D2PB56_HYPSF|nr:hypothetical protein HYPSUDRAFT_199521 [Hypholoma sublateritium FD-334 SS-4]
MRDTHRGLVFQYQYTSLSGASGAGCPRPGGQMLQLVLSISLIKVYTSAHAESLIESFGEGLPDPACRIGPQRDHARAHTRIHAQATHSRGALPYLAPARSHPPPSPLGANRPRAQAGPTFAHAPPGCRSDPPSHAPLRPPGGWRQPPRADRATRPRWREPHRPPPPAPDAETGRFGVLAPFTQRRRNEPKPAQACSSTPKRAGIKRELYSTSSRPGHSTRSASGTTSPSPLKPAQAQSTPGLHPRAPRYLAEAADGTGRGSVGVSRSLQAEARAFHLKDGNGSGAREDPWRGAFARTGWPSGLGLPRHAWNRPQARPTHRRTDGALRRPVRAARPRPRLPTPVYLWSRRTLFLRPARHLCNLQGTPRRRAARIDARRGSSTPGMRRPISGARFSTSNVESAGRETQRA